MGEYLKISGESQKIGTCENLYYASYRNLKTVIEKGLAEQDTGDTPQGYLNPKHGYRYRFPFPDEDNKQIGNYADYDRGECFTIDRENLPVDFHDGWEPITGWQKSPHQSHLKIRWTAENPNNTAAQISFEIVQQKIGTEASAGLLVIVCRDPYTGNRFRIEDKEDVIKIVAAISDRYMNKYNLERLDYYDEFCRRIYEGSQLPYISKKEVLQEITS